MQIKDEWRDALADRMHACGFGPVTDKDADFILAAVAPLIAAEAIEACADACEQVERDVLLEKDDPYDVTGDWTAGRIRGANEAADKIRREVPKLFGMTDTDDEPP